MTRLGKLIFGAALATAAIAGIAAPASAQAPDSPGLPSFSSEAELRAFLRSVIAAQRREERRQDAIPVPMPVMVAPPSSPPPSGASAPAAPSITNNQIVGVDEGDIVKLRGETLVVLRRGRLFTVSLAGGGIRPVSSIDAFPPGVEARGDWYDEMLVSGDRVIVVGYSYRRRTSEVNRFRIDASGRLAFEDSYQLRSSDYYSSRNYATRLLGSRLVLYSPLNLRRDGDPLSSLPAMRRWQAAATAEAPFRRIAGARRVFVPAALRERRRLKDIDTLHSVTSCDLAAPVLNCEATVVLGSSSRSFFVSSNAVYLWIGLDRERARGPDALVYRLPFDRSRPSAVAARGQPIDQFSFMPDTGRSALHVLVRQHGNGDAMWGPEFSIGALALLSIPTTAFGDGRRELPFDRYQLLPKPENEAWNLQNRWVGDHLLYGSPSGSSGAVFAVSLADRSTTRLPLSHGVERLDAIGRDGIVIGSGGGALGFTAIDLSARPRVAEEFRLPAARQGEARSHSFYFRPDPGSSDGSSGILGLPVARHVPGENEWNPRVSAAMLFLRRDSGRLASAGELAAASTAGSDRDDGCQASCVDWYGNARPIFIGERVFALLGYELVEGEERGGRIREVGRTSFAPRATPRN